MLFSSHTVLVIIFIFTIILHGKKMPTKKFTTAPDSDFVYDRPEYLSWLWWPTSNRIYISPEGLKLLQFHNSSSEVRSDAAFWSRVHEDDLPNLMDTSNKLIDGLVDEAEEIFRIRRGDESWAWILSRSFVIEKGNGKELEIGGTFVDLSYLRMDSKFHLTTEGVDISLYHSMLDNSPDLIARLNKNLSFVYINPSLHRYFTYPPEGSAGTGAMTLPMNEEHLFFIRQNSSNVFSKGKVIRAEFSFYSELRGEVLGEYTFWPELDSYGRVNSVIAQFHDNTEQIRAEQQARLNAQRLAALYTLNQMTDAPEDELMSSLCESVTELTGGGSGYIFIPHTEDCRSGRVFWSKKNYEMVREDYELPTTYLPAECLNAQKNETGNFYKRRVNNGDGTTPTHTVFDGQYKIMRYMHVVIFDGDTPTCIAAVSNKATHYDDGDMLQLSLFMTSAVAVLHRHRDIHALKKAKEEAELSNKIKDEFLANISHELRTPMNGILSMLQLLNLSTLSAEQHEYVRTAMVSGESLLRIIGDILDLSAMGSGKMALQMVPYCLQSTMRSTVELFRGELAKKRLGIGMEIAHSFPWMIIGDDARMRQIIFNVVGNAIKFTDTGGIYVYCCIVGKIEGKQRIYLSISDTGIGIPDNMHDAIFDAFRQVDSSASRKYAGTGLGLSIVKRLVLAMNGSITLESEMGKGTTFHFSLPFISPDSYGAVEAQGSVAKADPAGLYAYHEEKPRPLKILVVEDDAASSLALRLLLQRGGHEVLCVRDGAQALGALQLYDFDCVFTDIQMPQMDGLEMTKRIRNGAVEDFPPTEELKEMCEEVFPGDCSAPKKGMRKDIAITAVSAHAMTGDKERFLQQGVDFYISKPVALKELKAVIARIVRKLDRGGA